MKTILAFFTAITFIMTLTACNEPENRVLEDDLETIMEDILTDEELSDESFFEGLTIEEVRDDKVEWHLGTDDVSFEKAVSAVPAMSTTPFELTLIRANANQDVSALKDTIEEHADPLKWGSFTVDPENVLVDNIGDVVILIMSDDFIEDLHVSFERLKETGKNE